MTLTKLAHSSWDKGNNERKRTKTKKERDTRRDRTGGLREACVPRSCDESPTTFCGSTYICIFPCQFAHFHSVPGCRPVNLMRGEKRRERITAYKSSGAAWKSRWMAGIVKPSASALSLLGPVVKSMWSGSIRRITTKKMLRITIKPQKNAQRYLSVCLFFFDTMFTFLFKTVIKFYSMLYVLNCLSQP